MANGLNKDTTGFGYRSGCVYENAGNEDTSTNGWFFYIGSGPIEGPFLTKLEARAAVEAALAKLDPIVKPARMSTIEVTKGVRFDEARWLVCAHYPRLSDYEEEAFNNRADMITCRDGHLAAGANVQVKNWVWIETVVDNGWYSAKAYPGNVGKPG